MALDPRHVPGPEAAKARADAAGDAAAHPLALPAGGAVRFGTASWTDPTITRGAVFYPPGVATPEDRLRYYASRFSLVEVPEDAVDPIIRAMRRTTIRSEKVTVRRDSR